MSGSALLRPPTHAAVWGTLLEVIAALALHLQKSDGGKWLLKG